MQDAVCFVILISTLVANGCISSPSSAPLTTEETQILVSVARQDSMFYWTRFDGILEVYIDGADVVPNQNSQTTQAWLSAIKSLEQRGYISGEGLKAGVFRLTNEGRMAARKLSATVPRSGTQDPDESNAPILDAENE